MTTHAPMARLPFAPLDNPRLQHLASAKNRQNGLLAHRSPSFVDGKASIVKNMSSSGKRSFEPSTFDESDSENVDPALFDSPPKKSKGEAFGKPTTFSLKSSKPSMLSTSAFSPRLSTPVRANTSSSRAPMTAPAGRSPKRKIAGVGKSRRISAPFTRVDPPFGSNTGSSLPFSLDAALSGTFSTAQPNSAGATIQESMPKTWFFDIYEDTPEEEAANLMEHSTLTLDLSSDDESGKKERDDRGKENTPPEGYDGPNAPRSAPVAPPEQIKKTELIRRKVAVDEMDDGERSPLSALETEHFIPEGLDKESHVVVDETLEKPASTLAVDKLAAEPVPFTAGSDKPAPLSERVEMPSVEPRHPVQGEISVGEDVAAAEVDIAA